MSKRRGTSRATHPLFGREPQESERKPWSAFLYLCADHEPVTMRTKQRREALRQMRELPHMHVAVLADVPESSGGARRYVVGRDETLESPHTINTGDPSYAMNFFRWAAEQCPSDHIAVILAGSGIADPNSVVGNIESDYQRMFSFCDDETARDALSPRDLREVFSELYELRGKPVELAAFDVCRTQFIEVAYQMREYTDILIASQANAEGPDWPYTDVFKAWDSRVAASSGETEVARELARAAVQIVGKKFARPGSRGVISALELAHVDRVASILDSFCLTMMQSLGNAMVWEARDEGTVRLLESEKKRMRHRGLARKPIAFDLAEMLQITERHLRRYDGQKRHRSEKPKNYGPDEGGLRFWLDKQLERLKNHVEEYGDAANTIREFIDSEVAKPGASDVLKKRLEAFFVRLRRARLDEQLRQAGAVKARSHGRPRDEVGPEPPIAHLQLIRAMEWLKTQYETEDFDRLKREKDEALHLAKLAKRLWRLLIGPGPRSGRNKRLIIASSVDSSERRKRCGVSIHRPDDLNRLWYSNYLDFDIHRNVHWVALLGAINLVRKHNLSLWKLMSSMLSTASSTARDDLLRRLVGPQSIMSGLGDQFRSMASPPCVTVSMQEESTNDEGKHEFRVQVESSTKGATISERVNRINHRRIDAALESLEYLLRESWLEPKDMQQLNGLGQTLAEDIVQDLSDVLDEEWRDIAQQDPDGVLHMQLQLPRELMQYPWELMHDGEALLCQRYALGRQVFMDSGFARRVRRRRSGAIRALVIGDPILESEFYEEERQRKRDWRQLPGARTEAIAVAELFEHLGEELGQVVDFQKHSDLWVGKDVTGEQVRNVMRSGRYDIIHYAGHAMFADGDPESSAWMLTDGPLWALEIRNTLRSCESPPWLVFANACEAGMDQDTEPKRRYQSNVFGLATSFINQGVAAYIGPLWPINDAVALQIATDFYSNMLGERVSLGESLRRAKHLAMESAKAGLDNISSSGIDGLSWASLVLYGDATVRLLEALGTQLRAKPHRPANGKAQPTAVRRAPKRRATAKRAVRLVQARVDESFLKTLDGPEMQRPTGSRGISKEEFGLQLVEVNGIRNWQVSGSDTNKCNVIGRRIEFPDELREQVGLPRGTADHPHVIANWSTGDTIDFVPGLAKKYDRKVLRREQLQQFRPDGSFEPVDRDGLLRDDGRPLQSDDRVLLLLHDTLGCTSRPMNGLGTEFYGWAQQHYAAVISFDHWTLSRTPDENAAMLWKKLATLFRRSKQPLTEDAPIDMIAHGRGGLVARAFVELMSETRGAVKRVALLGTPNRGSILADPRLLSDVVNGLINLAHIDPLGVYQQQSALLARLLASASSSDDVGTSAELLKHLPGLWAQSPAALGQGSFLWKLQKESRMPKGVTYSAVAASYASGEEFNVTKLLNAKRRNAFGDGDLAVESHCFWATNRRTSKGKSPSVWRKLVPENRRRLRLLLFEPPDSKLKTPSGARVVRRAGVHHTNMMRFEETRRFLMDRLTE